MAEVTLETLRPVACDLVKDIPQTGRFVIIDNYEIAGVGIVLDAEQGGQTLVEKHVAARDRDWERSTITPASQNARARLTSNGALASEPAPWVSASPTPVACSGVCSTPRSSSPSRFFSM